MATTSYFASCPTCDGDILDVCEDSKLGAIHPGMVAFCLDCGWQTWVEEAQADLEEVNMRRNDAGLEPLNN